MSLKEDMLCEGTIKKKGPGFFFPEKNNSTGYFFFYILPNWFKYKKAIVVIYAQNDLHPSSGQRYTETKNL
jgi:hypothetical protein